MTYADSSDPDELAGAMERVPEPAQRERLDQLIRTQAAKPASPAIEQETASFFSRPAEQARRS